MTNTSNLHVCTAAAGYHDKSTYAHVYMRRQIIKCAIVKIFCNSLPADDYEGEKNIVGAVTYAIPMLVDMRNEVSEAIHIIVQPLTTTSSLLAVYNNIHVMQFY